MSAGPPAAGDQIDPRQVPVYPVLALTVEGAGARLNGRPLEVPAGTTPQEAAITAAAAEAARLPGGAGAIRVAARDTSTDRTWRMVVTADRQVLELPEAAAPRRRPWLLPVVAAGTALVLGGGAATAVVLARQVPAPTTTAAAPAPLPLRTVGTGANLPVTPPPGFAARAAWSVALAPRTEPIATTDGTVLAVAEDGRLVMLDPATGATTWAGQAPRSGIAELHLTTIDGQQVAATGTGRSIDYWPLPQQRPHTALPADSAPVPARRLELPPQAELDWSGSEPLAVLPDQTAAVIVDGAFARLDVPVGADAVAASDGQVTAVDPTGRWWRLDPADPEPGPPATLSPPAGATGPPARVLAAGPEHVVAVWDVQGGQAITLVDVASGEVTTSPAVPGADLTRTPVVHQPAAAALTLGPVLVDPDAGTLTPLDAEVGVESVVTGHVYGVLRDADRTWVDITTAHGTAEPPQPIPTTEDPGLPLALVDAAGGPYALVVADKVEQRLLHALPPTDASSAS